LPAVTKFIFSALKKQNNVLNTRRQEPRTEETKMPRTNVNSKIQISKHPPNGEHLKFDFSVFFLWSLVFFCILSLALGILVLGSSSFGILVLRFLVLSSPASWFLVLSFNYALMVKPH